MNTDNNKFPKVLLFLLSMAPFFIILGLMTMDIPITLDKDAEFIGWRQLWINTRLGWGIIGISIIFELCILGLFMLVCNKEAGEETELIDTIEDKNFELLAFVTSIFLPLISFKYDQLSHWMVILLIVVLIGYIFCHFDGFYTNPTLALFHYRLYSVTLSNQRQGSSQASRPLVVITRNKLKKGDRIRCVKLTDIVSYASLTKLNHE